MSERSNNSHNYSNLDQFQTVITSCRQTPRSNGYFIPKVQTERHGHTHQISHQSSQCKESQRNHRKSERTRHVEELGHVFQSGDWSKSGGSDQFFAVFKRIRSCELFCENAINVSCLVGASILRIWQRNSNVQVGPTRNASIPVENIG